jgi:hypothetical protein
LAGDPGRSAVSVPFGTVPSIVDDPDSIELSSTGHAYGLGANESTA